MVSTIVGVIILVIGVIIAIAGAIWLYIVNKNNASLPVGATAKSKALPIATLAVGIVIAIIGIILMIVAAKNKAVTVTTTSTPVSFIRTPEVINSK